jgi:hypothetical protein
MVDLLMAARAVYFRIANQNVEGGRLCDGFLSVCDLGFLFVCDAVAKLVFCCAGIRDLLSSSLASAICFPLRWHPRFAFSIHASPLCGAAPTFLCRGKEK